MPIKNVEAFKIFFNSIPAQIIIPTETPVLSPFTDFDTLLYKVTNAQVILHDFLEVMSYCPVCFYEQMVIRIVKWHQQNPHILIANTGDTLVVEIYVSMNEMAQYINAHTLDKLVSGEKEFKISILFEDMVQRLNTVFTTLQVFKDDIVEYQKELNKEADNRFSESVNNSSIKEISQLVKLTRTSW